MSDFGDEALDRQEAHLKRSLAKLGIKPRETTIPPPHYDEGCRVCGDRCTTSTLCGQCARQIDKGGR